MISSYKTTRERFQYSCTDHVRKFLISICLKDEKFRDLLKEYAEEISDPENRKRYEEEIAQLERDRGMDVKFINPTPGHVLKTSIDGKKSYQLICASMKVKCVHRWQKFKVFVG